MKRKQSIIYSISDEDFTNLVKNSKKKKDISDFFGVENVGSINEAIRNRIAKLNLDTSHFMSRIEASTLARLVTKDIFEKEWLVANSSRNVSDVKKYLVKYDFLKYSCEGCDNTGLWKNASLTLQLEHKDGDNSNNQIENLCFLCPNCHSQTETFAGRNTKTKKRALSRSLTDEDIKNTIPNVRSKGELLKYFGMSVSGDAYTRINRILKENPELKFKDQKTKITWPSPFELQKLLWEKPTSQIANDLGISDKAVEKHAKKHGLTKPPKGYWQKQMALPPRHDLGSVN